MPDIQLQTCPSLSSVSRSIWATVNINTAGSWYKEKVRAGAHMLCLQLESMIHDYKHTAGSDLNKRVCLKQGTERVHTLSL